MLKEPYLMDYASLIPNPILLLDTLTRIGLGVLKLGVPHMVTQFFLVATWYPEVLISNLLFPYLAMNQNIEPWKIRMLKLFG